MPASGCALQAAKVAGARRAAAPARFRAWQRRHTGHLDQMSSWIPHSRLRPKKRVSSSFMPGSQRWVVWKSPIET